MVQETKIKTPPGPKPWPMVGNLPEMLANKPAHRWIHNLMKQMNIEIACIRLGNTYVIPVTCPTIAKQFLSEQDAIFASRYVNTCTDLVTSGHVTTVLVPYGDQWKKMKKILTTALLSSHKHLWLQDRRTEEADNLMFYVYNKSKTVNNGVAGLVNIRSVAKHYCGNVIRKILFNKRYFGKGRKDGGPGFEEEEHVDSIFILLKYVYAFSISDFIPPLRRLDLDGHQKKVREALNVMKKYHDPIVQERVKQWNDTPKIDEQDWLDILISLKDADNKPLLTMEEISAQIVVTFLFSLCFHEQ